MVSTNEPQEPHSREEYPSESRGSALHDPGWNAPARAMKRLTDSHQHQEPSHEATKVRGRIAGTIHEIIGVRASRADPVGERCYDIGCDNDERQEIVPERRGENDQEKANGEDLHRDETIGN